ncbi:MAG: hypothetical protein ABI461_06600 [Polyangiaceae bacterium]
MPRRGANRSGSLLSSSLFAFVVTLLATSHCGGDAAGPCPLAIPEDHALCNSGGIVVYCHYDCATGDGTDAYALCSGPRWTVTKFDVCADDGGAD